ncbi:discoidin domain-containing protein [Luteolibacter marinus]|uniref:discoidin domain-containing protein n=1 Tax=Luteolibacter marinus TaxID=2776705 RepID=UPI001D00CC47|nr:discoidin domain-containing protein [Luteolibacter marinus]
MKEMLTGVNRGYAGLFLLMASGLTEAGRCALENLHAPFEAVKNRAEGIVWPAGQALPTFATPAKRLDAIEVQALSADEQLTFSALQGQVNRKQPRILLLDARAGEGRDTWPKTLGLEFGEPYWMKNKYELLAKYAGEVEGVVLYDPSRSPHYRNLAGTVAGLRRALPVTAKVLERMRDAGVGLKVLEDLTPLELTSPVEIYTHLLERYWKDCEKRLILSARPDDRGGDHHHTRDIAAAVGAAVVWLDNRKPEERDVMRKFFGDMKAGEAIALGWYTSERSGITTASEFGIGTMPADFFVSGSVYAGTDHRINIPPVPKMPELEDKAYVAVFISDGDNIQYTQHAMRQVWDRTEPVRGKIALNWTIAPGLVDIAPGILNYYYGHATPNDCFVTGPSGMGYMMPSNTLDEPGAPVGEYTRDPARMSGYTRLTESYLQRSGLRVITIWDDASEMQRAAYEKNCRSLYGATVQNFKDVPSVKGSVAGGRVRFDKLVIPYAGSYEHISGSLKREIGRWDGKAPLFLGYQADIWHELKPHRLVELHDELAKRFPGKVEFVRADHYFNLYNEANGLPYNLSMAPETTVRGGPGQPDLAADGTPATLWTVAEKTGQWLGFDFGARRTIHRYVVRHAGVGGLDGGLNTRDFTIMTSADGKSWQTADVRKGNRDDVTDVEIKPVDARYLKVVIDDPGEDGTARIAEVEVHGK